jgi:uncharacterized ferritin-like protein (DUF455 family)
MSEGVTFIYDSGHEMHEDTILQVSQSRDALSEFAYVLRRILTMQCAWLPLISSFETKTKFGHSIGYTAIGLEIISIRLREMNTLIPEYFTTSNEIVKTLDHFTVSKDEGFWLTSIEDTIQWVIESSAALQELTDPIYDGPTHWAIAQLHSALRAAALCLNLDLRPSIKFPKKDFLAVNGIKIHFLDSIFPPLAAQPKRPEILKLSEENILHLPTKKLLETPDGIRRFVHFIYTEIEISAAEICARNIVEFGKLMPIQFTLDMARQCSDEVRHAEMAKLILEHYGGYVGEFTYRNHVWTAYMKGSSLAEKLAIEQIIGEGNGLDTTAHSIVIFKEMKMKKLQTYYEYLQADETIHCAFGNRWISYLTGNSDEGFAEVVEKAINVTAGSVPGFAPVAIELRRNAEFSEEFIYRKLLKRTD